MKHLKLFSTHSGYTEFIDGGGVKLPNVSHCIQENEVHYSSNIESFRIFKEVFCDNVNETDREKFENGIIVAEPRVYMAINGNNTEYGCSVGFYMGEYNDSSHFETRTNCSVRKEITEEQYNQWGRLSNDELLEVVLPMFRCQGEAEHTWVEPIIMPS